MRRNNFFKGGAMIIGIPREIKEEELRVAITSAGVSAFVAHGHKVLIEKGAGIGSGILDKEYRKAGATIINKSDAIWEKADMILKVKNHLNQSILLFGRIRLFLPISTLLQMSVLQKSLSKAVLWLWPMRQSSLKMGLCPFLHP